MVDRVAALGLDIGNKRIGVAGCDGLGLIASGITTINRRSFLEDVAQIQAIVLEREVAILVVGLPYLVDGSVGTQARKTQKYAERLSRALNLPLQYVDERCTSLEAEGLIISEGRSPSQNKAEIDRKAAAIILQVWLDRPR
jgi:putative holliday junction resolvase